MKCTKRMSGGPVPPAGGFSKGGSVSAKSHVSRDTAMKAARLPREAAMKCKGNMKSPPSHASQKLAVGGVAKMRNGQYN